MKKTTTWMLMALLVVGFSMTLSSCKDDEMSAEEKAWHESDPYDKGSAEALDFWTVISQLTDLQTLPNDWKTANFEPTIGTTSDTDPYTRTVIVKDVAEAIASYSCLIGLSESLPDYTAVNYYSNNRVGTLNYIRTSGDQSVASVDVNIKQMPKLKKIVYKTPEQIGENASLKGSAYYHFGDVISRVRPEDGETEYWICVNPASHLTGKTESHWISVSDLPAENVYSWNRSDGQVVQLPTAICTKYTYMHDFAELLYAMLHPVDYFANIGQSGLGTFSGFSTSNFSYINKYYFQRIGQAWKDLNLYSKVLYTTSRALEDSKELNLFCKGYSWVMGKTGTLYTYTYSGDNWKTATWKKRTYDFKDTGKSAFNIHYWGMTGSGNDTWEPRNAYVVRYATGEALCKMANTSYDWKTAISGCSPVYVYNFYHYQKDPLGHYNLNINPQILTEDDLKPKEPGKPMAEVTKDDIGKIIGEDGLIYETKLDAQSAGVRPVAMVADTGNTNYTIVGESTRTNAQLEQSNNIIKGIAIALDDGNFDKSKLLMEDENVKVENYDKTWNNSHSVNGATWYVPNLYHWQRMLLPFGCTKIVTINYLRENYQKMISSYETNLKGVEGFRKALSKVGGDFADKNYDGGSKYLMAGGVTKKNESSLNYDAALCIATRIGVDTGPVMELSQENPFCCRYVLTW